MKVIAIVGMPGSGKTEAMKAIMTIHDWPRVYFGEITFDELKRQGLPVNEKNERTVREGLRAKFGKLHYAKETVRKIKAIRKTGYVLVESLYAWEEYLEFKREFGDDFVTIAVFASPKTRYRRLSMRPIRPLSPEDARNRDHAQIENLSQGGPIAMADYVIGNEGTKEELDSSIRKIIDKITEDGKEHQSRD